MNRILCGVKRQAIFVSSSFVKIGHALLQCSLVKAFFITANKVTLFVKPYINYCVLKFSFQISKIHKPSQHSVSVSPQYTKPSHSLSIHY